MHLPATPAVDAATGSNGTVPARTRSAAATSTQAQPNIILLNMESWRHLDVSVLGGAAKKARTGQIASTSWPRLVCCPSAWLHERLFECRGSLSLSLSWEEDWDTFRRTNGFEELVDDQRVRTMLHETRTRPTILFLGACTTTDHATEAAAHATKATSSMTSIPGNARHAPARHASANKEDGVSSLTVSSHDAVPRLAPPFNLVSRVIIHGRCRVSTSRGTLSLSTRYNKKDVDALYFSDARLGDFIQALRSKGLMKNTLVMIEGDHGYGRLEHDTHPSGVESGVWDEAPS
ncbi:hypothetical protein PsorP6_015958 [Peronosclerospora sorghi]|uniref:Uncharacterized protein n=1 Tax=Peronosclerospora sorghi TaxID=230839 RepID=A0ACC0WPF4_9STRA|nr:hypothetical protein PsorP6_015958 [Peronosclerospora sorghi]